MNNNNNKNKDIFCKLCAEYLIINFVLILFDKNYYKNYIYHFLC